jgi:hypothetical protein
MLYTEKLAGEFLEKEGFNVHPRYFLKSEKDFSKLRFPCVMKVSGPTIVHKARLGGVFVGVKNIDEARVAYKKIMKITGAKEVLVQDLTQGRFFILGIKKTSDFGHVLIFGDGGVDVEEKKDVSFRVCPVAKEDVLEMIKDTFIGKTIDKDEELFLVENLLKLCKLVKKYPKILELDINPIMSGSVVDSRIVWGNRGKKVEGRG